MANLKVEAAIAGRTCSCGPDAVPYTDAEGPRCLKCSYPLKPLLSRMTRAWLRQRVDEERAARETT